MLQNQAMNPINDVCSNGGMSSQSMHTDNNRQDAKGQEHQQAKMMMKQH